jgi:hypothetical protein
MKQKMVEAISLPKKNEEWGGDISHEKKKLMEEKTKKIMNLKTI